jgi:hypothetical protein
LLLRGQLKKKIVLNLSLFVPMSIKLIGGFKHYKSSLLQFNPALNSHPYVSRMQRSICSYKTCKEKRIKKGKGSHVRKLGPGTSQTGSRLGSGLADLDGL